LTRAWNCSREIWLPATRSMNWVFEDDSRAKKTNKS
jgi:hypothetical protein